MYWSGAFGNLARQFCKHNSEWGSICLVNCRLDAKFHGVKKKTLPGGLSLSGSPDVANCSLQLFFPTKLWYILQPAVQWHLRLLNKIILDCLLMFPTKLYSYYLLTFVLDLCHLLSFIVTSWMDPVTIVTCYFSCWTWQPRTWKNAVIVYPELL